MGTFVRRLVALTLVWLLATAALTYAASRRAASGPPPAATTTAPTTTTEATLVVPDVVDQPYVFAEGTLGDAGFSWHVEGSVQGFSANVVASQSPAPGTHVLDTGSPLIVLHLSHPSGAQQIGIPADSSPTAGTELKISGVAVATPTAAATTTTTTTAQPLAAAKTAPAVKKPAVKKPAVKKPAVKKSPAHRWPQNRPPAFAVPGARKEPLDEMPLTDRAKMLLRFIEAKPKPTDANVRYWLYQHAWIVTGARMGWWHGADALHTLLSVDQAVWNDWGIGEKSEAVARAALAEVDSRSS